MSEEKNCLTCARMCGRVLEARVCVCVCLCVNMCGRVLDAIVCVNVCECM
jgi:hypothetical protein